MNNTTLTVAVIMAAALMAGAMVITPAAYANDGNTNSHQNNRHKTIASGFLTIALNDGEQLHQCTEWSLHSRHYGSC